MSPDVFEVRSGRLECSKCKAEYPILEGVAIVVEDVHSYLMSHVKGISKRVKLDDLPKQYRDDFLEAQSEIEHEHIEEDLEAERVNALYLMNHFLRVNPKTKNQESPWWQPSPEQGSPFIDKLIREYWDRGPFSQIEEWLSKQDHIQKPIEAIELGCGVGGLYRQLKPYLRSYLGVDGSFASISMARHLALGVPDTSSFRVPGDLLHGTVSQEVSIPVETNLSGQVDWIVADLESLPLQEASADLCIALNTIDMLNSPQGLPQIQNSLLKSGGVAIQSCPYIWHEAIAKKLRKLLPKRIQDSSSAVKWLYEQAGFQIEINQEHVPWLFFKHYRQVELYSVHIFMGRKSPSLNT